MIIKMKSCGFPLLLILTTLGCRSSTEHVDSTVSCPGHQKAFRSACFEFARLQRSFFDAQAWCEQSGGHLAFITDGDTQDFVQRHLHPERDAWFGVATSGRSPPTEEGLLSWLDGSPVSFSRWVSGPPPGSACGHILRNSGFQWEATKDCGKKLRFICQFESSRALVCADHKPTLQCGSGQVIMVDRSFYGRRTPHYCRAAFSPATSTQQECGWLDVAESVAAHCDGRRLCRPALLMTSFGELQCAGSRSYMVVDFHCEDGLILSVDPVAAVFDRVAIRVKLLTRSAERSFSCRLDAGDGHAFYLHAAHGIERSVLHSYSFAGTFVVAVECIAGKMTSHAQKTVTVEEPVTAIVVIRCFAANVSSSESNCKALRGASLQIQTEAKTGTNVTYRVQRGEQLLSGLSVVAGNVPHNITVSREGVELLGPGCHRLTLHASNMVTVPEVSAELQVCVVEKVAGLRASMLTDRRACLVPQVTRVGVSLDRGAPVQLLFSLMGDKSSFSETKKMSTRKAIFHIPHSIQGPVEVKVRAWNNFSSLDVDVDISGSCGRNLILQINRPHYRSLGSHNKKSTHHIRVERSLSANIVSSITSTDRRIELTVESDKSNENNIKCKWHCNEPCKCRETSTAQTQIVAGDCLPEPLQYFKYYFKKANDDSGSDSGSNSNRSGGDDDDDGSDAICITLTPAYKEALVSLTCSIGCNPIQHNTDAKIKMICDQCLTDVIWGIEDPRDDKKWEAETKSCYKKNGSRPLIEKQYGLDEYTVKHSYLKLITKEQPITVVIIRNTSLEFTTFPIRISSSSSTKPTDPATEATTATTKATTLATTATTKATTATTLATTATTKATTATTTATTKATTATTTATTLATTATTKANTATTKANTATTLATTADTKVTTEATKATATSKAATAATTDTTKANAAATDTTTTTIKTPLAPTKTTAAKKFTITSAEATTVTTKAATAKATAAKTQATAKFPTANTIETHGATNKDTTAIVSALSGSTIFRSAATVVIPTCSTGGFSCTLTPTSGTVLFVYVVNCVPSTSCISCQYCLSIDGLHLRCSDVNPIEYVSLSPGAGPSDDLFVTVTEVHSTCVISTVIQAQIVDDTGGNSGVLNLHSNVNSTLAGLTSLNQLTGQSVAQQFFDSANKINFPFSATIEAVERTQLREHMLEVLITTSQVTPVTTPQEVYVIGKALSSIVRRDVELSWDHELAAARLLFDLSESLLFMTLVNTADTDIHIYAASDYITLAVSYMFDYSVDRIITDLLIETLYNLLSALLLCVETNDPPIIIHQNGISLYARRVSIDVLLSEPMFFPACRCAGFSLTNLLPSDFPVVESVDERMLSLDFNPYPWHDDADINSLIGGLSLTTRTRDEIILKDLTNDVEIFLPVRDASVQTNSTSLYLGNFSTAVLNITENNAVVVKLLPSDDPFPFFAYLGYEYYPDRSQHLAQIKMPLPGTTLDEKYTWLLEPDLIGANLGVYYIVIIPIVAAGVLSVDVTLTITTVTPTCRYWNEPRLNWTLDGCRAGPKSTPVLTHCLCNHLTFFGGALFVTPNLVDPSRTIELFRTFTENPVVVSLVAAVFGTYFIVVVWARMKDLKDAEKVKVTVLDDNNPKDEYQYLLSISTGHRLGAATSSQVTLTLLGAEGTSEPHHMTDPEKVVFERGAVDLFLLCTPLPLGELEGVRLWHNNTGEHSGWFVSTVTVRDLQTEQQWYFLCNTWLSLDMEDCCLDYVFPSTKEDDMKMFSNLFFSRTSRDFNDGHIWFSVVNRPASSTFSCVQRVSCCLSLLLCTMLTSIMFYGVPTDPSEEALDIGPFEFTWQQFIVGIQSSLIMFPVNILIVTVFRSVRPRETTFCQGKTTGEGENSSASTNVTLDSIVADITRLSLSLSKSVKNNVPSAESELGAGQANDINAVLSDLEGLIKQDNTDADIQSETQPQQPESSDAADAVTTGDGTGEKKKKKKSNRSQYLYKQLCEVEKDLDRLGPSDLAPAQSHSQALQQVQRMKASLEEQLSKSNGNVEEKSNPGDGSDVEESEKEGKEKGGLPWWFMLFGWLLVIASSVVAGFFTMLYGLKFGKNRSLSWLTSMSISFFQSLLFIQPIKVLLLAVFFSLVVKKVDGNNFQNIPHFELNPDDSKDLQAIRSNSSIYKPPPAADIERLKRNKMLAWKAFALLREILTYLGFMWMLLLVAYGQRDANEFLLNKHIRTSFTKGITDSMSLGDVFTWANTSLLGNLYGAYPGFITDGNSKLVGNARLRQLRVQKTSCPPSYLVQELVPKCHVPYSWDVEDTSSYEPGWNRSLAHTCGMTATPWMYQTQTQLRSYPTWGNLVLYRGGGFVAELGPELENASSTLEHLFRNKWLDSYTRAIFVEFTVYNANVNLFCIVTLLLETAAVGAFQLHTELQSIRLYQSTGSLYFFFMAAEIIYMLFVIYYMYMQGKLMKQQRWAYFKSKWNLVDLTIILLSWSAAAVFIIRTLLGQRDIAYYQNHKDQFASFYETASADATLRYLIAFVVLLATVKLWHLLRLHPKMNMISSTLQRAWIDISGFLVVILIMVMAYSISTNVIYGWRLSSYKTLADAIVTIISLQMGMFNYGELLDNNSLLGGFLIGSCVVFLTFVVVNLLISVILGAFTEEQIHHKPSEDEEVVDMMLTKICSLFGVKFKGAQEDPEPDVNGSDDKNVLNAPPEDDNTSHPTPK